MEGAPIRLLREKCATFSIHKPLLYAPSEGRVVNLIRLYYRTPFSYWLFLPVQIPYRVSIPRISFENLSKIDSVNKFKIPFWMYYMKHYTVYTHSKDKIDLPWIILSHNTIIIIEKYLTEKVLFLELMIVVYFLFCIRLSWLL